MQLQLARDLKQPVVLHVITQKGRGYAPAQEHPKLFHGIGKFNPVTGEPLSRTSGSFSSAFGEKMMRLAEENPSICAVTAAMPGGTGLLDFKKTFSERLFDVGIAEEHAVPFALGLAKGNMVPVFVVYSTFLQRCYDQLMHDCALQNSKMIIAVDRAGIVGDDGETHNGIYDTAFFNGIPNITVYSPSYYADLNNAFVNALYHREGPCVIRYPRGSQLYMPEDYVCSGNSFDVFGDSDAAYAIVTYGRIFGEAYKAYEKLKSEGKKVKILKLNIIVPIPEESIEAIKNVKKVFFFEEGVKSGGVGESFASVVLENKLSPEFILTAFPDCFVKQGKTDSILKQYNLDSDGMYNTVKENL